MFIGRVIIPFETYLRGIHDHLAVIYETADPGKFPDDIEKAIGKLPDIPERIALQKELEERIYDIEEPPATTREGSLTLSEVQYEQVKSTINDIFKGDLV